MYRYRAMTATGREESLKRAIGKKWCLLWDEYFQRHSSLSVGCRLAGRDYRGHSTHKPEREGEKQGNCREKSQRENNGLLYRRAKF